MRPVTDTPTADRPTHRRRDLPPVPVRPAVVLGPVEEGSLLVFAGLDVDDPEWIHAAVADMAGHDRFLLLFVNADAGVRLVGPDELAHALRALVALTT